MVSRRVKLVITEFSSAAEKFYFPSYATLRTMKRVAYIFFVWVLSWPLQLVDAQDNTACRGTTLDWYTSVVGETPCAFLKNILHR